MEDKFVFSDAQDLSAVDSTGVISSNVWDLEEDAVADQMVMGWINILICSAATPGCVEGMWFELRTDDDVAVSFAIDGTETADEVILGAKWLELDADMVAGREFCFGVCQHVLGRYMAMWYRAHSTASSGGTLTADVWFSEQPSTRYNVQKKNATTGAS